VFCLSQHSPQIKSYPESWGCNFHCWHAGRSLAHYIIQKEPFKNEQFFVSMGHRPRETPVWRPVRVRVLSSRWVVLRSIRQGRQGGTVYICRTANLGIWQGLLPFEKSAGAMKFTLEGSSQARQYMRMRTWSTDYQTLVKCQVSLSLWLGARKGLRSDEWLWLWTVIGEKVMTSWVYMRRV
jgi:hypothetical protein